MLRRVAGGRLGHAEDRDTGPSSHAVVRRVPDLRVVTGGTRSPLPSRSPSEVPSETRPNLREGTVTSGGPRGLLEP